MNEDWLKYYTINQLGEEEKGGDICIRKYNEDREFYMKLYEIDIKNIVK